METWILIGQAALVAGIGGWIATGAWENLRAPEVNFAMVREVLAMTRIEQDRPELWGHLKVNRIRHSGLQRAIFWTIVAAESVASLVLLAGAVLLVLAAFGLAGVGTAKATALAGTTLFTAIWAAFLVGGNWVHYWITHEWSQATHFFLVMWGTAVWIALAVA